MNAWAWVWASFGGVLLGVLVLQIPLHFIHKRQIRLAREARQRDWDRHQRDMDDEMKMMFMVLPLEYDPRMTQSWITSDTATRRIRMNWALRDAGMGDIQL